MNSVTVLPSNIDAERALLSALFADPDVLPEVRNIVQEKDFYLERNQAFYRVLCNLYDQNMPFDTYLFMDEVEKQKLTGMIDMMYFMDIVSLSVPSFYAKHYMELVKDESKRRDYWRFAENITKKIHDGVPTEDLQTWISSEQNGIVKSGSEGMMSWEDSFNYEDKLLDMYAQPAHLEGLEKWTMPWDSWGNFIDPAENGVLINIAGPDGIGKTVCGEMFAEHWARNGLNGVYVHFELNRKIMIERRLCRYGTVPRRALVSNTLHPDARNRLDAARNFVRTWPGSLTYLHAPGWTMDQVVGQLRYLQHKGLCDFAVIDYLEKAKASARQLKLFDGQYQREADDVETLKNFSEDDNAGCRVVMLSQLGKAGKQTPFNELTRDKIRGAGEKTEKANVVVLLHKEINLVGIRGKDGTYSVEPGGYDIELGVVIDKNTLGKTGRFRMQETTPFFSLYDKAEFVLARSAT